MRDITIARGYRHPYHKSWWPKIDSGEIRDPTRAYDDELWVVSRGSLSEYEVVAVFSTREKAEEAAQAWGYYAESAVIPLDPEVDPKTYTI